MKRIEVRESKIPLIVGILDFIVFFIFLVCFSIASLSDNAFVATIFCIMIFGGFCFLGIYLIISYFRRIILHTQKLWEKPKHTNIMKFHLFKPCSIQ